MRAPDWRHTVLLAATMLLAACATSGLRDERTGIQVTPKREVRTTADERARREASIALHQAGRALADNDLPLALRHARKAVAVDPASADPLLALGVLLERAGQLAEAGETYRKALLLAPGNADAANNYGAWLCAQGHEAEALVIFDRAITAGASAWHSGLLANAGTCALRAGQPVRAERDLRVALQLEPENAQALQEMARLQLQRGELMSARAFYQRRLAAAPATVSVLQIALEVEQGLGDSKAVEQYRQLLQQNP